MSAKQVVLVSAFGRSETLALALFENGYNVRILDFTEAFAPEYQRGVGPFPVLDKAYAPVQRVYLNEVELQPQGLTFWLKDGPLELTGPLSGVHIHRYPEVQAWKTNRTSGEFGKVWLSRFLRQWSSPVLMDSWGDEKSEIFPAELPLGLVPASREVALHSFERERGKGIEVLSCTSIRDVRIAHQRIEEMEVEAGRSLAIGAEQWVWCLSSSETRRFGEAAATKIFNRAIFEPEWTWLSFEGQMNKGPWSTAMPDYVVIIGDIFLPWIYSNLHMLRRTDETHFRVWLKVPLVRISAIDARRTWAAEVQRLLQQRLPLADWKIDSANWKLCPHSQIYLATDRPDRLQQWKNSHLITPEVLPRLDMGARLEREAEVFRRLIQWREQSNKQKPKHIQGGRSDQPIHPA